MKGIAKNDYQISRSIEEIDLELEKQESEKCPHCGGAGYFVYDVDYGHPQFGVLQMCECKRKQMDRNQDMKAQEAARMLDRELGTQYYEASFEKFDPDWPEKPQHKKLLIASRNFCEAYASAPDGWLMLHGKGGGMCGSGKSLLAAAIAKANAEKGVSYATVPDLFSYILSDWTLAEQRIAALSNVRLLVCDDMGQETVSGRGIEQFREKFFRILNNRDRKNLPTVITSNYTLDELGAMDHYSEAIISRIYGQTEGRRIFMNVPDYRRRGRK